MVRQPQSVSYAGVLRAVFGDGVQRGFQGVVLGGIGVDAVAAGGEIAVAVHIELVVAVGTDHLADDTQLINLPVNGSATIAAEGIPLGGL